MKQCYLTKMWPTTNGVINSLSSDKNELNIFGIKHKYGKRKGQLKKNKTLTEADAIEYKAQNAQT